MSIVIRAAEPTDVEAVFEILTGETVRKGTLSMPFQSREGIAARLDPDSNRHRLVAVQNNQVVGFAEVETFAFPRLRHVAHLNVVAVRDDTQGNGIGTVLLEACIDLADNYLMARRFYLEVWVDNHAVKFYEKYGFEIEGRHIDFAIRDGHYADIYTMARIRK